MLDPTLFASLLPSWRIVSADDFGATDGPELCLGRVLNTFRLPRGDGADELVGTIVIGDLDLEDIAHAARPWAALRRHHRSFRRVFCDQRAMTVDPSHLVLLFQRLSCGPLPERATCLVATPWTMHLWHGIARLAPQVRLEAFMDEGLAWRSIDASEAERNLVALLTRALQDSDDPVRLVIERLLAAPHLTVADLARRCGFSTRSLQRALAARHESFASLRDRVRLVVANKRLREGAKVASVADDVGFASVSHFVAWYKKHHGVPPGRSR